MAATTSETQLQSETLNFKTWVLKVSIHCEGCKKKVKKILNSVPGVSTIDIDAKQHKVVVTGNVEANALLKKLLKSGKHAELLLPEQPEKSAPNTQLNVKQSPTTVSKPHAPHRDGAAGSSGKNNNDVSVSDGAKPATAEEQKVEEKKRETEPAGNQKSAPANEVNDGQSEKIGGGDGSGTIGKKKKKKGQNGKSVFVEQSSALPARAESPNHSRGLPQQAVSSNDSPPRHYDYPYQPPGPPPSNYYAPPPAPVYAVSYNTAQPSSSYTASYYAPTPPQSYAYSYSGQEMGPPPPPSDYETYPRQPLDSLEMFSDENPNGCSVM